MKFYSIDKFSQQKTWNNCRHCYEMKTFNRICIKKWFSVVTILRPNIHFNIDFIGQVKLLLILTEIIPLEPSTLFIVGFFFLEHTAEFKETDHKSQFCMCEKNKNNIQTRKVNLHIFISFFRTISAFSQLQTHTITKISLKNFHSKISRKKINFDAEFLAVSHAHNLMLEWSKFSSQKGWQPTRRV